MNWIYDDTYYNISLFGIDLGNLPCGFQIGSFRIAFYGIIIACGMLLAVLYACKRSKQFGLTSDDLIDAVLCLLPVAIICARLYYCIFKWSDYKDNLISVLYIWNGGLAIYGAVIGVAIGTVIFARIKKIKIGAMLDIIALGLLIGQAVGRWGNFFNREAFGETTDSFLKMGLQVFGGTWEYYHPTFLYESLWNAAGLVLLHFLSKKRKYDGQIALGYAAWYGLGRTFIEGLRTDSLYIDAAETLRVSQLVAAITCLVAVGLLMYFAFKKHDPAKMQVNLVAARQALPAEPEKESGMEPLIAEDVPQDTAEEADLPAEEAEEATLEPLSEDLPDELPAEEAEAPAEESEALAQETPEEPAEALADEVPSPEALDSEAPVEASEDLDGEAPTEITEE